MLNSAFQARDALHSLTPFEVVTYLRGRGWRQVAAFRDTATIWQADDPARKLLVPWDRELDDYAQSIGVILDVLQEVENRPQAQIWQDVSVASADVVRIRLTGERVEEGSLPIDSSVTLIQRARDLMLAAASSAVTPRAAFPTRKPDRAVEYLKTVRTGQTERGSYVLTLISPVEPALIVSDPSQIPLSMAVEDQPFERRVMGILLNAMTATRQAAEMATATNSQDPFANVVDRGVSANLCEAIADIIDAGGGGMELSCAWSHVRPAPRNTPRSVFVSGDFAPIIRAAAKGIRDKSLREEEAEVRGFVVITNKRPNAATGKVVIQGTVNGQVKRVEAKLTGQDYKDAVRAHEDEAPIVCYGRVAREGNSYVLRNARNFQAE